MANFGPTLSQSINGEIMLIRRLVVGLTLISLTTISAFARSPSSAHKFMVATVNLVAFRHGEECP